MTVSHLGKCEFSDYRRLKPTKACKTTEMEKQGNEPRKKYYIAMAYPKNL